MERYCIMSVYRQEAPDFYRDLFFNAPRNDSQREYIRTRGKNTVRRLGVSEEKGGGQAQGVSAYAMAARREQISLLPRPRPPRYPLHFPGYRETGYTRAWGWGLGFQKRKEHFSHLSSTGNAPIPMDVYGYLFPGKLVA